MAGPLAAGLTVTALAAGLALAPSAGAAASRRGTIGGPQLAGHEVVVNYPATKARPLPKVNASAYVIADAGTGQVLAAKDPHGRYLPASTLKVLTAISLMPVLKPDATVVTTRRAANVEPSKVGLIAGHNYRISDLFKAMLLISANDAAMSVAQATGSVSRGVAMMNAQAHHLQAYDEALFARQALTIPRFMQDEQLRTMRFPLKPGKKPITLWNQNTMLETYRGDLGGKIGWTTASKATFIGWARRGGHTLVVTILHCKPLYELTYAARLLDWGFDEDGKVKPVGVLVPPLPAHTVAHPVVRPAKPRALPPPAKLSLPGIPMLAGLGTLMLASLAGVTVLVITRRGRRAGSPPAD
jgi:D-alanyl-D-alanine carboxypeptidase (penicillin-binding protein 5/6)